MSYWLVDVERLPDLDLELRNRADAKFRVASERAVEDLLEFVKLLLGWLKGVARADMRKTVTLWARALIEEIVERTEVPKAETLLEVKTMLEERVIPWGQRKQASGHRKGREEGLAEGRREILLCHARMRFGEPLDAAMAALLGSEKSLGVLDEVGEITGHLRHGGGASDESPGALNATRHGAAPVAMQARSPPATRP